MELNKILFWVLGIYVLFKFEIPYLNEINDSINKLNYLNYSIQRYKNLLKNERKIEKDLKIALNINKLNSKYFFSSKIPNNIVYVTLQNIIKKNAKKSGFDIDNFKWELVKEKNFYYLIPLKVTFKTIPSNFKKFLGLMCKENKIFKNTFIKTEALSIYRNVNVKYQIELTALKLKGKN